MIDWNREFESAHLTSWPEPGLMVQVTPVFKDQYDEIMAAAKRHGYVIVRQDKKTVSFGKTVPRWECVKKRWKIIRGWRFFFRLARVKYMKRL